MCAANPSLVLEASHVVTPAGLILKRVTPYECALGAGDVGLAKLIGTYFSKIPEGKKERAIQYERYRLAIEGMLNQPPYDLSWLMDIIKNSSADDVTAALNSDKEHVSKLRDALVQFRNDIRPGTLIKSRMHYNYQNLIHALICLLMSGAI